MRKRLRLIRKKETNFFNEIQKRCHGHLCPPPQSFCGRSNNQWFLRNRTCQKYRSHGELLFPDAKVALTCSDNPNRKTKYDLISVYKESLGLVNIDSQAPNKIVGEWLATQDYTFIKPEYKYGDSRLDFYMEKGDEKYLLEVKGCTLEINGIGYFPDAPSERAVRHVKELIHAKKQGYHCILAFRDCYAKCFCCPAKYDHTPCFWRSS